MSKKGIKKIYNEDQQVSVQNCDDSNKNTNQFHD